MASILPGLARGLVAGTAGYLQGQRQGQDDAVARKRQADADLFAQWTRSRAQQDATQQDADRQRQITLSRAQNAQNGIYEGAAPTDPTAMSGAMGGVDFGPRYQQVPGAYIDVTRTPEARANRTALQAEQRQLAVGQAAAQTQAAQRAASAAAVRRFLQQRNPQQYAGLTDETLAGMGESALSDIVKAEMAPTPGWQPHSMDEFITAHRSIAKAGAAQPQLQEGERMAAALLPEAEDARQALEGFSDPTVMQRVAAKAGLFGNYMNTTEGRQMQQAANQFISAVLVAKSGKAVTEQEAKRYYDTYIPSPGDDAGTLQRKQHARELGMQAIRIAAGRAAPNGAAAPAPDRDAAARRALQQDAGFRAFVEAQSRGRTP